MRPTRRRPLTCTAALVAVATMSAALTGCNEAAPRVEATQVAAVHATRGAVAWTFDAGSEVWSSPVVDGTTLFVGSDDGVLHALDLITGKEAWSVKTDGPVRARPAVAGGVVYVTSDDGSLYAVREKTGKKVWTTAVGTKRTKRDTWTYQGSSPTVAGGRVFVGGADGTVRAVDARSGKVKWTFKTDGPIRTAPAVADDVVYVGGDDRELHALTARTGAEKWFAPAPGPITSSPTIAGDTVYVGNRGYTFNAFATADGTKRWSTSWGDSWVESTATVVDGTAFVGSSDIHQLRAVRVTDGEVLWRTDVGGWPWSSPAVADGVVYAGSLDRPEKDNDAVAFHAVDAKTGQVLWSLGTGPALKYAPEGVATNGVVSSPVVAGGLVVFGALDGKVYAVGV
jgi:eukaryotic-like serine/threonine-protein kinase